MNKFPIVEIEWLDHASDYGWGRNKLLGLVKCKSSGYLISEDKEAYHLAQSFGLDEYSSTGTTLSIGKKLVTKKKILRKK